MTGPEERFIPPQIRTYCERCLLTAVPKNARVLLHQHGKMRLGPEKPWMPFKAEQTLSATEPAFCWRATFTMARIIPGVVVDRFENGRGHLDAKLLGLIRVAHGEGPTIDRSQLQRYLAEIVWCPMALLHNQALRFQVLSPRCVRLAVRDEETYVDLLFDADGDICGVKTLTRYRGATMQPWQGRFAEYRVLEGVRIPTLGEVWWQAPEGRFVYWQGKILRFSLE